MVKILQYSGWSAIIVGIVLGLLFGLDSSDGFRFAAALSWWFGGIVSGIVLFALASILEYVEAIFEYLKESSQTFKETYPETGKSSYPENGKSKLFLDKSQEYKMKNID